MKNQTVLYLEDEQWAMQGVIDSLNADYNVIAVRNADEGLAKLENQGAGTGIDAIVLDIMMPLGSKIVDSKHGRTVGVEFAREVLINRKYTIPIICYTVVDDVGIREELLKIGVREIVSKESPPSELKEVIDYYLSNP